VDQLERAQALAPDKIAALRKEIQSAETSHLSNASVAKLKQMAFELEKQAAAANRQGDSKRLHALATILEHPSA
jgi:hypothetical protein